MNEFTFTELQKEYVEALLKYEFNSEKEGMDMGIPNPIILEKDRTTGLESPYTMKISAKKEGEKEIQKQNEYMEEESSEYESTESEPYYGNIEINVDLFMNGKQIIEDSNITLIRNEKYGLVGRNGIGKTALLKAIRKRKFGIPRGLKIHAIKQDFVSNEKVIDFIGVDGEGVLNGLGFNNVLKEKRICDLSGGWRMRAQLAKAIHIDPDLLLLDEPTNFLDIKAIGYLEAKIPEMKTVIVVSHDRNFLNNTVRHIFHLKDLKIETYKGNYQGFVVQLEEKHTRMLREYQKQQADRIHLQSFVDRFRYNAKRSAQAQSKLKILEKMPELPLPKIDPKIKFHFESTPSVGNIIELEKLSFSYKVEDPENKTMEKNIFKDVNLIVRPRARIVIVGENGQGKTTLLKILAGNIIPDTGRILRNPSLNIGYFTQHHADFLDQNDYLVSYVMKQTQRNEDAKRTLGSFGLNTINQKIGTLSGGQKSRLVFALLNLKKPNLLLLDEPTNHLDMETIDGLSDAINEFQGAVLCVSHDLAFIEKTFSDVYICENGDIQRYNGTANDYKNSVI